MHDLIKHFVLLKIQNMLNINVDLLQWSFDKNNFWY